ncbi:MAG TPA: hypothetical protein VK530_01790 [Candidatus Acidoferrum sp.]|nr:hypothetical protein [Candidatus Acidoferrum sp.]
MIGYRHVQRGTWLVATMFALAVVHVILGALFLRPLMFVAPLMILAGWLFHSLAIEVNDGELRWQFGPGFIHKQVPLEEIKSVTRVRTNFIEGWGIHFSRFGWLYNVSGYDAVAIALKSGKQFALGTDEPDALVTAIARSTEARG